MPQDKFKDCIQACGSCAAACSYCAVACLREDAVEDLTKCIRLDMECAVFCRAAAGIMSLESGYSAQLCQICTDICNDCAEECEKHAAMGMAHCRECADTCRQCAAACKAMAEV